MWCVLWVIALTDHDRTGSFELIEKVIFWPCALFILICVSGKDCNNGEYAAGVLETFMFARAHDNESGPTNVSFHYGFLEESVGGAGRVYNNTLYYETEA